MPCSIYLSASHKSAGKTIVSLGLCAAFKQQSLRVQAFKKGPDYIDPIWLTKASGRPCYNLDFYTSSAAEIKALYQQHTSSSDVSIIEGNKGLYDGLSLTGGDANADLAKLLKLPVILVLDASGITRGIAPLLKGYQQFDASVNIAGVIVNQVAGDRHQTKLINAIEYYTDVPVLGAIRRSSALVINERHLGLMPANETAEAQKIIDKIAENISQQVDLNKILDLHSLPQKPVKTAFTPAKRQAITLAIAFDSAFGFYYQDDLDSFKKLGVKVVYFSTIKDKTLPSCDGLFIGGGFPETQTAALSDNRTLLKDIHNKIKNGLPTYAECGGLMYLSRKIIINTQSYPMAAVVEADTIMSKKPIGRGYVQLEPNQNHLWNTAMKPISAHEFHYSKLVNINPSTRYAYRVLRGVGIDNQQDGILLHNLLASYTHLRSTNSNRWVEQFVDFIIATKQPI